MRITHLILFLPLGCTDSGNEPVVLDTDPVDTATSVTTIPGDEDGDGFTEEDGDCNDSDAAAYPGATEICDGVDNDCNGLSDELSDAATLDGAENFPTIQQALDAAADGSFIVVCDGIWGGPLTIDITVSLSSVSGQYDCILDGQAEDSTVTVMAPDVKISGVTITGGLASIGGGVNGVSAARLQIEQSIITLNTADFGGGVYLGADGEVTNAVITQNTALSYGGGVAGQVDANIRATNATIEDNSAQLGGGVFLYEHATLEAIGATTVSDNIADSGGGAYVWSGALDGGQVEGNDAIYGGGLYFFDGGQASNVLLISNTAHYGGGALVHGTTTLSDTLVTANDASVAGGGLFIEDGSVTCSGTSSIDDNTTSEDGGGASISDGSLVDCTLTHNHADNSAGGLLATGDFTLDQVVLDGNTSDVRAGGLYANGPVVGTLTGGEITDNTSVSWGGGIYANNGADLAIDGTLITQNNSDFGAGLYIHQDSSIAIANAVVEDNGNNATTTGGGARIGEGDLVSTNTDWGVNPLDNTPDDVVAGLTGAVYIGYETSETFTCDASACAPVP